MNIKNMLAVALLAFGGTVVCFAGGCPTTDPFCVKAPEIDMGTVGAATAFAGCVLMMARGRRKN
jgi:hypothetical protein